MASFMTPSYATMAAVITAVRAGIPSSCSLPVFSLLTGIPPPLSRTSRICSSPVRAFSRTPISPCPESAGWIGISMATPNYPARNKANMTATCLMPIIRRCRTSPAAPRSKKPVNSTKARGPSSCRKVPTERGMKACSPRSPPLGPSPVGCRGSAMITPIRCKTIPGKAPPR